MKKKKREDFKLRKYKSLFRSYYLQSQQNGAQKMLIHQNWKINKTLFWKSSSKKTNFIAYLYKNVLNYWQIEQMGMLGKLNRKCLQLAFTCTIILIILINDLVLVWPTWSISEHNRNLGHCRLGSIFMPLFSRP